MKNIRFIACTVFAVFFTSFYSYAQLIRETTFDDRPACEQKNGAWRAFGNGCVDECFVKFDKFAICTDAVTYGCDCGTGRCWNGETCVALKEYKKLFDAKQKEEEKIAEEEKAKRHDAAKDNQQAIMNNLLKKTASLKNSQASQPNNPGDKQITRNNYDQFFRDGKPINSDGQAESNQSIQAVPQQQNSVQSLGGQASNIQTVQSQPDFNTTPPQVPPLFLQQEKSKREAEQKKSQAQQVSAPNASESQTSNKAAPSLPVIPLPQ